MSQTHGSFIILMLTLSPNASDKDGRWRVGTSSMSFALTATWEKDLGLGLFRETKGIRLGYTCSLQEEKQWCLSSDLATLPLGWHPDQIWGMATPFGIEMWMQISACPPYASPSLSQPRSATWRWRCSVNPLRLPPHPTLREAGPREAGLAGGGLRCSRAEKRCPAVAGHAAGERGAFRGA